MDNVLIGELRSYAMRLPDIKKSYFRRSLFLVKACRRLTIISKEKNIAVYRLQEWVYTVPLDVFYPTT